MENVKQKVLQEREERERELDKQVLRLENKNSELLGELERRAKDIVLLQEEKRQTRESQEHTRANEI